MRSLDDAFLEAIESKNTDILNTIDLPQNSNVIYLGLLTSIKIQQYDYIKIITDRASNLSSNMYITLLKHLILNGARKAYYHIYKILDAKYKNLIDEKLLKDILYYAVLSNNTVVFTEVHSYTLAFPKIIESCLQNLLFCQAIVYRSSDDNSTFHYIMHTLRPSITDDVSYLLIWLAVLYEKPEVISILHYYGSIPTLLLYNYPIASIPSYMTHSNPFIIACESVKGHKIVKVLQHYITEKDHEEGFVIALQAHHNKIIKELMVDKFITYCHGSINTEISKPNIPINTMLTNFNSITADLNKIQDDQLSYYLSKQDLDIARLYLKHNAHINTDDLIRILNVNSTVINRKRLAYIMLYELLYTSSLYNNINKKDMYKLIEPLLKQEFVPENSIFQELFADYYALQLQPIIDDITLKIKNEPILNICPGCGNVIVYEQKPQPTIKDIIDKYAPQLQVAGLVPPFYDRFIIYIAATETSFETDTVKAIFDNIIGELQTKKLITKIDHEMIEAIINAVA
ncbi:MAG: hypothetical protein ACYCPT_11930 [Acidimicrobiales bacterium]